MQQNDLFERCFDKIIELEGGYVLHRNRGEKDVTYAGIYRHANPNWEGWKYIDNGLVPPKELVVNFYKTNYWDKYSSLPSPLLKWIYFECSVNTGHTTANKIMQLSGSFTDIDEHLAKHFMQRVMFYYNLSYRYPQFLRGWIKRLIESFKFAGELQNEYS